MSLVNKRKHAIRAVLQDVLQAPAENQTIVRVIAGRGNNLHEVEEPSGTKFLASMPTRFRRNFWIKRGDYVLVEPIPEGDKVKAEIVLILTAEHLKFYRNSGCWPQEFKTEDIKKSNTFANSNKYVVENSDDSTSEDGEYSGDTEGNKHKSDSSNEKSN